ncbi:MAG: OmpA family protein [Bacteroidales bacterium]|nr:OmpA family protein [Bacteroidales bacterium]
MKTKLLLLSLCISSMGFAQTGEKVGYSEKAGIKTEFKNNKFCDNWYLSVGGGIASYFGTGASSITDQIEEFNPTAKLSVGKWINPMFGLRLQGVYGQFSPSDAGSGAGDFDYAGGHIDGMLDLMNTFGRYNEKRVFSLIPFVGAGYGRSFNHDNFTSGSNGSLTFNSGLIGKFRLSSAFDLSLELANTVYSGSFDGVNVNNDNYDYNFDATLNLAYKFKTRTFTVVEPMDYAQIQSLNDEINSLRSQLADANKRPRREQPKPAQTVQNVTNYIPNVVYFKINSAVIRPDQQISIRNVADFLKAESDVQVKVIGYADKKTGNPTYNNKLSEKRAKAVAKVLTDKYGISSSRISMEWKGDTVQPYDVNEWNRVVIFEAK